MLRCGLYEEEFSSRDALRTNLEGHASQLFDSDEEHEENEIKSERDSDQDSDVGSLILDCVKEEEQLQGQLNGTQSEEGSEESPTPASSKTTKKRRTLRAKQSSSETFMCSKCSYKTINKKKFNAHMNQMHLNKIKCNHCPKRYPSEGRLAYHIEKEHMKNENKPKLPEDEFFRIKERQGKRKKIYECLKCTFKTGNRPNIYIHIRSVHKKLLDELYTFKGLVRNDAGYHKCTECFFKTVNVQHLRRHIKAVHQKRRDLVCDLCKKTFSVKVDLMRHMKNIHISDKSSELHKCSICGYKTTYKQSLKGHLKRVHLNIREFTCDLCQKKFSMKSHLRWHIEKHHLERNILHCNRGSKCSFRTTNKRKLLKHIRRVHEKIQMVQFMRGFV